MNIQLFLYKEDNTEDIFEFESMSSLLEFLSGYTLELLIDSNETKLEYKIVVNSG